MSSTDIKGDNRTLALSTNQSKPKGHRWTGLYRNKRALIGITIVTIMCLLALAAPVVAPHDPNYGDYSRTLHAPTKEYLLGTDSFGRDIFSRVIYGLQVSLIVAFASVIPALLVGIPLGLVAGYEGKRIDGLIMRPMDLLISFPPILLAITLVAMFGTKLSVTVIALTIIWIPVMTRILRGSVVSVRSAEFVEAARSMGVSPVRITIRHVLPNSLGPLIVQTSICLGVSVLIEAALSFVGLGTQPPNPSLGGMLAENKDFMSEAPWSVIFPGVAIMIIVLSFNLLGDGMRDMLVSRRRS